MVVQLSDRLYEEAAQHAIAIGFPSVDEYVADVVLHDLEDELENIDHLMTPERLERIDRGVEQIRTGKVHTSEQVEAFFERRFAEWRQNGES